MTVLVALMLFGKTAYYAVRRLLEGEVRRSVPRATLVGYSEVEQIEAYIPEVILTYVPFFIFIFSSHGFHGSIFRIPGVRSVLVFRVLIQELWSTTLHPARFTFCAFVNVTPAAY